MDEAVTVTQASRNLYFWISVGAQALAAIGIWVTLAYFHKSPNLAYISALFAAGPSAMAIYMLVLHEWSIRWAIGALALHSAILIVHFAGVQFIVGLRGDLPATTIWDALYFSIVTWTTLGYGDLTPSHDLRMLAAIEAVYGYVFLGLIVALLSASLKRA